MRYLWRQGDADRRAMLRCYWFAALYKLGFLDYPAVAAKLATTIADKSEEKTRALCERWFEEMAVHYVAALAAQRVQRHRTQGHAVTLISASTPYFVEPVATYLGLEEYLCTRLEVVDGLFTGGIVEPACYGAGKVHWATEFAARHNTSLSQAYFYSDSYTDCELLRKVGYPVAVNPDNRLKATALRLGWPVECFY
jgi:putative phosphoserine phosphatase/1-acylglycerol-3-phosphate O-acyltransferase